MNNAIENVSQVEAHEIIPLGTASVETRGTIQPFGPEPFDFRLFESLSSD